MQSLSSKSSTNTHIPNRSHTRIIRSSRQGPQSTPNRRQTYRYLTQILPKQELAIAIAISHRPHPIVPQPPTKTSSWLRREVTIPKLSTHASKQSRRYRPKIVGRLGPAAVVGGKEGTATSYIFNGETELSMYVLTAANARRWSIHSVLASQLQLLALTRSTTLFWYSCASLPSLKAAYRNLWRCDPRLRCSYPSSS
jgi:hypothetical protein